MKLIIPFFYALKSILHHSHLIFIFYILSYSYYNFNFESASIERSGFDRSGCWPRWPYFHKLTVYGHYVTTEVYSISPTCVLAVNMASLVQIFQSHCWFVLFFSAQLGAFPHAVVHIWEIIRSQSGKSFIWFDFIVPSLLLLLL